MRNEQIRFLVIGIAVVALIALFVRVVDVGAQSNAFLESFDGTPGEPQRFEDAYPNWDVQYHVRHHEAWDAPPVTNGHHGPNCEAPLATHQITQWEDTVYQCANHVMTAANGNPGYGLIYLTPDHMADWSDGEAVIRFDISTHRTNQRDWWDVWIAPFDENMARPLEEWYPDLAGPQETAIQIKAEDSICVKEYRNYHTVSPSNLDGTCQHWKHISDVTGPLSDEQRARQRETVEIRISDSLVSVSLNGEMLHEYVPQGGSLPFSQGVVQFGHHSYTPDKNDTGGDGINTWHWDEVHIEPSVPFYIGGTDTRWVDYDYSGQQVVTLDEPAPANAYLRFASTGGGVELSFDGGPFETATMVNSDEFDSDIEARSYWHPIPEGTESFRAQLISSSWADNTHKMAQDFSVWSLSADTTPTSTPTATNTVAPTAMPTSVPTATAEPEPTPTPDVCQVRVNDDGVEQWVDVPEDEPIRSWLCP